MNNKLQLLLIMNLKKHNFIFFVYTDTHTLATHIYMK